jgi:organic hydroperoxide reductase OsmC/OhrA
VQIIQVIIQRSSFQYKWVKEIPYFFKNHDLYSEQADELLKNIPKSNLMNGEHNYSLTVKWTGNTGTGTSGYRAYERSHTISIDHKPDIEGSSDPAFRGDKSKHNPEDMLVAALSACHMMSYLHVCVKAGIVVTEYVDHATGIMIETGGGAGRFREVTLNPVVKITDPAMIEKANELHRQANALCFIANSVNFPVGHNPVCLLDEN